MPLMHKLGTLTPCIYFVNHRDSRHPEGYLMLAPYSACPTPEGYSREEAGTLDEVDKLQNQMLEQCRREWEAEANADEAQWQALSNRVTENMKDKLVSATTSEYDKEFIRYYLQVYRPEKRAKYKQRFLERNAFIWARENDCGDRKADSEEFHPDRLTVKS